MIMDKFGLDMSSSLADLRHDHAPGTNPMPSFDMTRVVIAPGEPPDNHANFALS